MYAIHKKLASGAQVLVLGLILAGTSRLYAQYGDFCDICGHRLGGTVYLVTDKITGQKKVVCADCEFKLPDCFLCGLPVLTNLAEAVSLEDGRFICARDAKTAVFQDQEGVRVCQEVKERLQRQLSRFLSLPDANVSFAVIDRLHLQELFKFAGHDYQCPNVWGLTTSSRTLLGRAEHKISILSGLPLGWFQTTCAHEFGHAWIFENVSEARQKALSHPAQEGFCELVGYMFAEALGDQSAISNILANAYTRGQIQVFVATEKGYGINDILDWMKYGTDDRLSADDLGRVRQLASRGGGVRATKAAVVYVPVAPAPAPDKLVLKSIFWSQTHPSALINDGSFFPGDQGKVRVGSTNVLIKCLEIRKDVVRVQIVGTGQEQELRLKQ